jgi:hypothetical protein
MTKNINDQIVEYQQSQQEAAEALSQAQSRVAELQALATPPDRRYHGATAHTARQRNQRQRRCCVGRRNRNRGSDILNWLKTIGEKITSRKLAVTAVVGAATATGAVDLTWPMATVAIAYVVSQAVVDAVGD